jgi:hypothetical protein
LIGLEIGASLHFGRQFHYLRFSQGDWGDGVNVASGGKGPFGLVGWSIVIANRFEYSAVAAGLFYSTELNNKERTIYLREIRPTLSSSSSTSMRSRIFFRFGEYWIFSAAFVSPWMSMVFR